jgi:predicted CXXCH cytochrome family protein
MLCASVGAVKIISAQSQAKMSHPTGMVWLQRAGYALSAIAMLGGLFVFGCSTATKSRLMNFFFEYPDDDAASTQEQDLLEDWTERRPAPVLTPFSRHAPFVLRQCDACHAQADGQSPIEDLMSACKTCHPNYFAAHKVVHLPVVDDCSGCHHMHLSRHPALLRTRPPDLCLDCHDPDDEEMENEFHVNVETTSCTICHDPHFGETKGLLRPNWRSASIGAQEREGDGKSTPSPQADEVPVEESAP